LYCTKPNRVIILVELPENPKQSKELKN